MALPYFTLLILKKNAPPLTVKVGAGLISLIILFFFMGTVSLALVLNKIHDKYRNPINEIGVTSIELKQVNEKIPENPALSRFFVEYGAIEGLVIKMAFEDLPQNQKNYVWIIANSSNRNDSVSSIYPRGPLFRGLPVDYRGGIEYIYGNEDIIIELDDDFQWQEIDRFNVLVFCSEGKLILNEMYKTDSKRN